VPNIASFGARIAGEWWPWMCPPAHLWFFSSTTLPRLLQACGFEVSEVRTQRGDGNNLYQYALMAAGNELNELRLRLRRARLSPRTAQPREVAVPSPAARRATSDSVSVATTPQVAANAPSGLLQRWLGLLERAQPVTNALARATRLVVEPLERRGWGDELLVYAKRK